MVRVSVAPPGPGLVISRCAIQTPALQPSTGSRHDECHLEKVCSHTESPECYISDQVCVACCKVLVLL